MGESSRLLSVATSAHSGHLGVAGSERCLNRSKSTGPWWDLALDCELGIYYLRELKRRTQWEPKTRKIPGQNFSKVPLTPARGASLSCKWFAINIREARARIRFDIRIHLWNYPRNQDNEHAQRPQKFPWNHLVIPPSSPVLSLYTSLHFSEFHISGTIQGSVDRLLLKIRLQPTPGTRDHDYIWKKSLCSCKRVKDLEMTSSWFLWTKSNDVWCRTERKTERRRCEAGGRAECSSPKPKTGHAKLKKEKETKIRMPPEPL